jgi:hypothetical protein
LPSMRLAFEYLRNGFYCMITCIMRRAIISPVYILTIRTAFRGQARAQSPQP